MTSVAFGDVAIVSRSGVDESVHQGAIVVLDRDGQVVSKVGDPGLWIYPRSSNKPMQADAMLRAGVDLDDEQLALACASHDGTDRHVAIARRTLSGVGLAPEALGNVADLPLDRPTAEHLLARGGTRSPLFMNCSGKHAAMLATCVACGWQTDAYLTTDHPLQVAITDRVAELTGGVSSIGVDGCGAPAHVVRLIGLARAFRHLALEKGRVWTAMSEHPELVGGERRDVTRLMRLVPGLMAKEGAEGVFAAALPDGRAAAIKIADGSGRAAGIVVAAALAETGVDIDPTSLGEPILGGGEPVGHIRPVLGAR